MAAHNATSPLFSAPYNVFADIFIVLINFPFHQKKHQPLGGLCCGTSALTYCGWDGWLTVVVERGQGVAVVVEEVGFDLVLGGYTV